MTERQRPRRDDALERVLRVGPEEFKDILWPDVVFYDKQWEVVRSVQDVKETVVPAGNQLGKDFVSAFVVLWFFLTRSPCRIVTTSVADHHLTVLWDEIDRFIRTSKIPLTVDRGGPLLVKHQRIVRVVDGVPDEMSYIWGMVAETPEKMSGHHATATSGPEFERWLKSGRTPLGMFVVDEASGVLDSYQRMASAWYHRALIFGNPWPCTNFFYRASRGDPATGDKGGDLRLPNGELVRRVIKITVEDSPNVRRARWQISQGQEPDDEIVVPGIKTWGKYREELVTKDRVWRCVSHSAEFPEDSSVKMYPPEWLDHAELVQLGTAGEPCLLCGKVHEPLARQRQARAVGVDSAQGGDNTCWIAVDDLGLIDAVSEKTPDTSVIPERTLAFVIKHGVAPEKIIFDYGGGGKQHVDLLRRQGYNVQAVMFGETATAPLKRRGVMGTLSQRVGEREERQAYKNRRAEMYDLLSRKLDPTGPQPYGLPRDIMNRPRMDGGPSLRRQMELTPKRYSEEGVLFLPPKNRRPGAKSEQENLVSVIGCSPDEMDALVLAHFGLTFKPATSTVRVV